MDVVTISSESLKHWQDDNLEYLRYQYPLSGYDTVLDIGSYQREWGKMIEHKYGCKVIYFDALDNTAAWTYTGKLRFGGNFLYTSIFADKTDKEYECLDIADYLNQETALVKINIEGGEYELLSYIIEKGLMSNIRFLQVQFHMIQGADCKREYELLAKRLSVTHRRTWFYPFCWENWERK